jgi:hypothetical protein
MLSVVFLTLIFAPHTGLILTFYQPLSPNLQQSIKIWDFFDVGFVPTSQVEVSALSIPQAYTDKPPKIFCSLGFREIVCGSLIFQILSE